MNRSHVIENANIINALIFFREIVGYIRIYFIFGITYITIRKIQCDTKVSPLLGRAALSLIVMDG